MIGTTESSESFNDFSNPTENLSVNLGCIIHDQKWGTDRALSEELLDHCEMSPMDVCHLGQFRTCIGNFSTLSEQSERSPLII